MSKYPTTNIVFSGMEDKGGPTLTIIDERKGRWTIWKKDYEHKDQDSEAYNSIKNYQIGESFGIEYGEKEESFVNKEGQTINFTKRTIYKILPLVAHPTQVSQTEKSSNGEAPRSSQGQSSEAFGRRLAIQGHINALLSNPAYYYEQGASVQSLVAEAIAIEDEAEKQISPSKFRQAVQAKAPNVVSPEDEPTIQVENDGIDVSDIPF